MNATEEHYAKLIRECNDPIWKRVLILDKKDASRDDCKIIHNWDHIVEVCGSEETAIAYLEGLV